MERIARAASRREIAETWLELRNLSVPELKQLLRSKTQPAIVVAMSSALLTAIDTGDISVVFRYYERLLGKPRQAVDISAQNIDVSKLTDEQLDRLAAGEDPDVVLLEPVIHAEPGEPMLLGA